MAATLAAAKDSIVEGVPLRRIGEPDDVGGTCVFLSSQAGSYINGCAASPSHCFSRGPGLTSERDAARSSLSTEARSSWLSCRESPGLMVSKAMSSSATSVLHLELRRKPS